MLTKKIEQLFSKHPPEEEVLKGTSEKALKDGDSVVIIGGGIAGSSMARYLLKLCKKENINIRVTLINSTNCNYCGGLITDLALKAFDKYYDINVHPDQILSHIDTTVYINNNSDVEVSIHTPLISTLRTSKFGLIGFDDYIKDNILSGLEEFNDRFEIIEPTLVKEVKPIEELGERPRNWEVVLSKKIKGEPVIIKAHSVVLATGLRGVNKPMLKKFGNFTDYIPPEIMSSSVTEVDTSKASFNNLHGRVFILDGVIPDCVVALVCKGKYWVTITALNKKLTFDDIKTIFSHPILKKYIDLPNPVLNLRCGIICGASVFTTEAKNFYGDNWVAIGDLTGQGRVLKDGYYAGLISAKYAAMTMVYHGTSKADFRKNYHVPLKRETASGNWLGMKLFYLNNWLIKFKLYNKIMSGTGTSESYSKSGGPFHGAIRALTTGDLSYYWITALFVLGVAKHLITSPFKLLLGKSKG